MRNTTMKRFASICAAIALCLSVVAVPQAWADASDATATVVLAPVEGQSSVDVTIQAGDPGTDAAPTLNDVTAISLALDIEITGGDAATVSESFAFSEDVKKLNPTITRASMPGTNEDSSVVRMNIYAAGMQDALATKSLNLGRVNLSTTDGTTAQATVVVPDVDNALVVVGNAYDETAIPEKDLFVPATPTVQIGDTANPPAAGDNTNGTDEGNGNGDGSDIVGQTPDTNPNKGLASTGDTLMPVIVTLICIAAVAAVVIVVMVVRKKKATKQE